MEKEVIFMEKKDTFHTTDYDNIANSPQEAAL